MPYHDAQDRGDWIRQTAAYRRIPAMLHVIAEKPFWTSSELFEELEKNGYRRSYKSFQRDVEFLANLGFIAKEVKLWRAGRSTHIQLKRAAQQDIHSMKIPSNIDARFI
jgi:hypothetical protein